MPLEDSFCFFVHFQPLQPHVRHSVAIGVFAFGAFPFNGGDNGEHRHNSSSSNILPWDSLRVHASPERAMLSPFRDRRRGHGFEGQAEIRHHGSPPGRRSVPNRGLTRPAVRWPGVSRRPALSRRGRRGGFCNGLSCCPFTPACGFFVAAYGSASTSQGGENHL